MALTTGTRLGAYEILSPLGAGGMGEVYRARDPRLNRDVAVKILSPDITADPSARDRFEREARAAAALNHPNIIAVHDIGTHGDVPYLVCELLQGETLRERLSSAALPPPRVLEYGRQIAQGLAAAHEKGIIHRDLKPENIFITTAGHVKILDFGLARLTGADASRGSAVTTVASPTALGTVMGTAGYMAPEQVRGEPADQRSDLFSLGAVLYEMLEGRRAFAGLTAIEAMTAVLRDDPPEISSGPGSTPLARVIRRCLEKRPDDRFQSARDLAFALSSDEAHGTRAAERPPSGPARRWIAAAAVLVLAIVIGAVAYYGTRPPAAARPPIGSLVVLPLVNLSNDPDQEYFADGMTEALISSLSRVTGLERVISWTSAKTFKATGKPLLLPQIASQLGVDAVVEGSVARAGDRVRITVSLIPAHTDAPLWSRNYERGVGDVLALQAEVTRAIVREIQATLTPKEEQRLALAPAVNREAQEDYLRGRYFLAKGTEESLTKAIASFTAASRKDATYAKPFAGLADAYTMLRSTYLPPHDVMPKAKAAAAKALELDPDLAEAHVSMGGVLMFYDFDWPAAERALTLAIELSPNLALAHDYYAMYLAAVGRHAEAADESRRALALDPLSVLILSDAGWVHYLAKNYDQTVEMNRRALDMDPNFWFATVGLGLGYEKQGKYPEAIATLEKARAADSNPAILEMLAGAYAASGRKDKARQLLAEMTARAATHYVCPYEVATVYATLGDKKSTLEWLEKGYDERADCMPWVLSDSKLEELRGYPGFDDLIRRMRFPR